MDNAKGAYPPELTPLVRKAFSRDSLIGIIEKHRLYERERVDKSQDEVIHMMRNDIRIRLLMDSTAFEVSFDDTDAARAQQITRDLVGPLIGKNVRSSGIPASARGFRIDHPPSMPQKPFWPNRMAVTWFGFGLGLLMGAAMESVRVRRRLSRSTVAS